MTWDDHINTSKKKVLDQRTMVAFVFFIPTFC